MKTSINTAVMMLSFIMFLTSCSKDDDVPAQQLEAWEIEVEQARAATTQYVDINVATNEGFFDASGFVPNMGHHYILPPRFENGFNITEPEILLYAPDGNGNMEFVAIEYGIVVPDPENPGSPPEGFSGNLDEWHFNHELSQWQLHVWIGKENPDGIFAPHNPALD